MLSFDHIAIAGASLDAARDHVESALGVALQPGGSHAVYGTHNCLLGLDEGLYLEAIAIDPDATPQQRPRWFDLDRFSGAPRITNWICRTDDMTSTLVTLPEAGLPVALARGDLRWTMSVPKDAILPFENMFPALIQWHCDAHPAALLPPSGCRMRHLTIHHPQADQLSARLSPLLSDPRISIETGPTIGFYAEFDTPHGRRVLT